MPTPQLLRISLTACLALVAGGAIADRYDVPRRGEVVRPPAFIGSVAITTHDGVADDLLTAGLGKTGLGGATPAFVDPLHPTAAELRRNAIYTNYRAVLDISAKGGYGTLYGPNVDRDGNVTASEGKIAGSEYITYANRGHGDQSVTLMVQVPDSFDASAPCIVTAPSSGSRGVYGAIGASGEWGLKRGCAVAYTDKGTGNGLHDLVADTVNLIDGTRSSATSAGAASIFTAPLSAGDLAAFNAATPNRVAYKHAHSQLNPERDWGRNVLQSIVFAFYVINDKFGSTTSHGKRVVFDRRNTLVIASGISNGAGASLAAAEQDEGGLIDGVAVTEPQIQPASTEHLRILQGGAEFPIHGRPLIDYFTYGNLYQPCAALAASVANAPAIGFLSTASATNRCAALKSAGLLGSTTTADQANEALQKLHDYGWLADSDPLQASMYRFATNAIVVTYSNTYGRFSVKDNLCGFSYANTDAAGVPIAQVPALQAAIFATGNGVPPTTGVNIVYNDAVGGPRLDLLAVSPSSATADFAFDGALCDRSLVTGLDAAGNRLQGSAAARAERLRDGVEAVQVEADLHGKPAIIAHGRSDALIPVNHASRAYYGRNQIEEGSRSGLRYIEVTNAQHFDTFIASPLFAGYDSRFVPLHLYLIRVLDAMWTHLKDGQPLPPSQVVHTVPRGGVPGAAPAITAANVPSFTTDPAASDQILMSRHRLHIPD